MGQYYFERIQTFSFLGSILKDKYVKIDEILTRIMQGNKAFFKNNKLLSSKLTGRQFKMIIYVPPIKPMVAYAIETWILTERNMHYLMIFERKILKKSFGPVQERDEWRIRTNHELNKLIVVANTLRFIKSQRLKWWCHLHRMDEYTMVRRVVEWSPMGKKSREHPRRRWRDEVLKDVREMSLKNQTKVVMDRSAWHGPMKKLKPRTRLNYERRRRRRRRIRRRRKGGGEGRGGEETAFLAIPSQQSRWMMFTISST